MYQGRTHSLWKCPGTYDVVGLEIKIPMMFLGRWLCGSLVAVAGCLLMSRKEVDGLDEILPAREPGGETGVLLWLLLRNCARENGKQDIIALLCC